MEFNVGYQDTLLNDTCLYLHPTLAQEYSLHHGDEVGVRLVDKSLLKLSRVVILLAESASPVQRGAME